jgi:hypothetical protein
MTAKEVNREQRTEMGNKTEKGRDEDKDRDEEQDGDEELFFSAFEPYLLHLNPQTASLYDRKAHACLSSLR